MIRIILIDLALLALPFAAYAAWLWFARRDPLAGSSWQDAPFVWLIAVALVMMILALVLLTDLTGEPADGGSYIAPHVEDGRIVPGRFERQPK